MRCSIIGCKSDSGRKMPDLSFHSFPEDITLRQNWIVATGQTNWTPKPTSKICSKHFMKNDLIKKKKLTVLFPNAVPILETNAHFLASSSINLYEEIKIDIDDNLCTPETNAHVPPSYSMNLHEEIKNEIDDNLCTSVSNETNAHFPSTSSMNLHEEIKNEIDDNLCTSETDDCVSTSSTISLHEEIKIEVDDYFCTPIELPPSELLPSSSYQKPTEIYSSNPNQSSIDKGLEFSPWMLQQKWRRSEKLAAERLKKLKCVREKCRRLKAKVAKLENVITELKAQSFIN